MADLFGTSRNPFGNVVGQRSVIEQLKKLAASPVHAYMILGMEGVGKLAAAEGFAATLVCEDGDKPCGSCWNCEAVMDGRHPDVNVFSHEGPSWSVEQTRDIGTWSLRSPSIAKRRVLVLRDFHTAEGAAPALLKSLEEPPQSTVFIVIANSVTSPLRTIASRCVIVRMEPLSQQELVSALVADGVAEDSAHNVALVAGGSLSRARRLVSDPESLSRSNLWRSIPDRLEAKNGALVIDLTKEVLDSVERAVSVVEGRQADETKALAEARRQKSASKTDETELEKAHKRQRRKIKTDELRMGLSMMANRYLEQIRPGIEASGGSSDPRPRLGGAAVVRSVELIRETSDSLFRNPVEPLAIQALLIRLADILEDCT